MVKTVLAFGSFDILHPGHIQYLKAASKRGRLTVVVARDSSIKMVKGRPPVLNQKARLEMVGSLRFVDKAVLGNQIRKKEDFYKIVSRFNPDYIVLGYDQRVDMTSLRQFLRRNKMKSRLIRSKAYNKKAYKSSKIAKKILEQ